MKTLLIVLVWTGSLLTIGARVWATSCSEPTDRAPLDLQSLEVDGAPVEDLSDYWLDRYEYSVDASGTFMISEGGRSVYRESYTRLEESP